MGIRVKAFPWAAEGARGWENRISLDCAPIYPKCSKSLNIEATPSAATPLLSHAFRLLMTASTCEVGHTILNTLLVFFILTYLILTTTLRGMY